MSSESIKNRCGPDCPKVKEQLRAAIKEAPWLLDKFFPRKKDDAEDGPRLPSDLVSRDARAEPETRAIEPADVRDEDEIDRLPSPVKLELEPREPVEPKKRVYDDKEEEEGITDYDRFIDEEMRKTLATAIAREFPEEPRVVHREIVEDIATVIYEEDARPREREYRELTAIPEEHAEEAPACDETCPLIVEQRGERSTRIRANQVFQERKRIGAHRPCRKRIMRKLKERQRLVDHYYVTKGFNYFEDVCKCSLACVIYTLSRDEFVRSVFSSLALFAVGLKLCSELDGWEMPSHVL